MKVFKYWSRVWLAQQQVKGFGYDLCRIAGSNISQNDALAIAQQRLAESLERLQQGKALCEYEYGSHVLTEELIEEITEPNGELIAAITRNRYGALVLNTQKILFADIDAENRSPSCFERFLGWLGKPVIIKDKPYHLQQITQFSENNPEFELIVYETFAGFRVAIASHEFESLELKAQKILSELGSDPLYAKLCQHQDCFRARLTPKPWRCGSAKPNHRFPFVDEKQAKNMAQWQKRYDELSHSFKVCNKTTRLGKPARQPEQNELKQSIEKVLRVHDAYVLGASELPLA